MFHHHSQKLHVIRKTSEINKYRSNTSDLHIGLIDGDLEKAKECIYKNTIEENNAKNHAYQTPLHIAARKGYTDICKLLIQMGVNINARDNYSHTPLHYAALYGYFDICKLLIQMGVNINARDNYSHTPLHYAALYGYFDIVDLLKHAGADTAIVRNFGKTYLDFIQ